MPDTKTAIDMALLINISTKMAIDDHINNNRVCLLSASPHLAHTRPQGVFMV